MPPCLLPLAEQGSQRSWSCCWGSGLAEPTTAPSIPPVPSTTLRQLLQTDAAGGACAPVLLGDHWQDWQRGNKGSLGRLSQVKFWASWGGGGNVTAQRQTRGVQLQGRGLRDWEKAGSSLSQRWCVQLFKIWFLWPFLLLAAAPPVPLPALGQVVLSLLRS